MCINPKPTGLQGLSGKVEGFVLFLCSSYLLRVYPTHIFWSSQCYLTSVTYVGRAPTKKRKTGDPKPGSQTGGVKV